MMMTQPASNVMNGLRSSYSPETDVYPPPIIDEYDDMGLNENHGSLRLLENRELGSSSCLIPERCIHAKLVRRMSEIRELPGHGGCVNCLSWSHDGKLLLSGSDDTNIKVWTWPHFSNHLTINSGHRGNIFSAMFLPLNGYSYVVSGSADGETRLHTVYDTQVTSETICQHEGRVKSLAVAADDAYIWYTACEDGTIRMFDRRQGRGDGTLIARLDGSHSFKCMDCSRTNPNLILTGADDSYARLFDRRFPIMNTESGSTVVKWFCPRNLRSKQPEGAKFSNVLRESYESHHPITCVRFSPKNEVLVSYSGDVRSCVLS